MNIAIIICAHGKLAIEMLNTTELIIGKQKNIDAIEFLIGEGTNDIIKKYNKSIKKLNIEKGLIFFVDIWGGSPYNAANKILNEKNITCDIISGINIPMMLETLIEREENNELKKLIKIAIKNGKLGINNTNKNLFTNKKK